MTKVDDVSVDNRESSGDLRDMGTALDPLGLRAGRLNILCKAGDLAS